MCRLKYDLLLIGNGFDLACGLHTSYNDFYYGLRYADLYNNFEDFYTHYFSQIKETQNIIYVNRGLNIFYNFIRKTKEFNFFIKYFKNYANIFESWHSVEEEIKNLITVIDTMLDNISPSSFDGHGSFIIRKQGQNRLFDKTLIGNWNNIIFSSINNYHDGYISTNIQFNKNPTIFYKNIETFKHDFIHNLYKDFKEFNNIFSIFINVFSYSFRNHIINSLKSKKIITYNFTNNAEERLNYKSKNVFYIHGKVNQSKNLNSYPENNIIIGISGEIRDFKNVDLINFTKNSLIIEKNTNPSSINSFTKKIKTVCVFGHSLDMIDVDSLRTILMRDLKSLTIYYHDENSISHIQKNIIEILNLGNTLNDYMSKGLINFVPSNKLNFK